MTSRTQGDSYYDVVREAVADLAEHGYDDAQRVERWTERLRAAARSSMRPLPAMDKLLRDTLTAVYTRLVSRSPMIDRYHVGVDRFTIERLRPRLRAELDRRIMASASLIKLNRDEAVEQTLRRFQGWATSIPAGGSQAVDKAKATRDVRKSLRGLPFRERRVLIDQGHKLTSSISDIIAHDGGAIAGEWRSKWRQANYNYRKDHKERDGQFYTVRGNWALEKGLMRPGLAGYTDDVTSPGEEVFCGCWYRYVYNLSSLPEEMLTRKGREALAEARGRMAA